MYIDYNIKYILIDKRYINRVQITDGICSERCTAFVHIHEHKSGEKLSAKLNYFCKLKMYIMHRVAHIFSVTLGLAGVLNIHYLVIMAPVKDCDILGSK